MHKALGMVVGPTLHSWFGSLMSVGPGAGASLRFTKFIPRNGCTDQPPTIPRGVPRDDTTDTQRI
jgi:hypothetical protein